MEKKILVIDIGGTSVKLMISREEKRKFESGRHLTPKELIRGIEQHTRGWEFEAIALGFPAPIRQGEIIKDPNHLAPGWVGYDFTKSFGKPIRVINDAALQALGSYHGGRMLFLGLGTGLGSALVWERNVLPLELGHLPYPGVTRIEDVIGKAGLEKIGKKAWRKEVLAVLKQMKLAFIADYVVVGGGNSKQFDELPEGFELGHNRNAYLGGRCLWETDPKTNQSGWNILG